MRNFLLTLLLGTMGLTLFAQTPAPAPLVDTDYARAFRISLPAGGTADLAPASGHFVVVPLAAADLTINAGPTEHLIAGQPLYLPPAEKQVVQNAGSVAATAIVVEIKRHWEVPVRGCLGPACARPIRIGDSTIGETRTAYSNGFLTVFRHEPDRGGTLDSSYYAAEGVDRLVFVAVTDLAADFDGVPANLLAGQPYAASPTQVEVNAAAGPAIWVVIRIHDRK
jgi:hypothetical protein